MNRLPFVFSIVALAIAVVALSLAQHKPKIGFIRSQQLVYNYLGMKEAQSSYQSKQQRWESEIDTLSSNYRLAVSRYNTDAPKLSAKEKADREAELRTQQEYLQKHSWTLKNQSKEEDEKLTQGVLNQVNTFVADYGKQHGYDFILGTTDAGNLLYGESGSDITDEILAAMNNAYKSGANGKH